MRGEKLVLGERSERDELGALHFGELDHVLGLHDLAYRTRRRDVGIPVARARPRDDGAIAMGDAYRRLLADAQRAEQR